MTLAWFDVLPGGWTLRGWVQPHAEREAERWTAHRLERLAAFAAEPTPAPGSVVFLGSSTMERFPLDACFPGAPALDRGIGMEDAARLLRRVPTTVPADAAGVVVYAGSIDFRVEGVPAEALRARVERVLDAVERAAPDADVLLLGLLPERTWDPARQDRLARANGALADLAAARGATFLDPARPPLVTPEGSLVREHSADELHLAASGYAELARRILAEGGPVGARLATGGDR